MPNSLDRWLRISLAVAPSEWGLTAWRAASLSDTLGAGCPPHALRCPPAVGAVLAGRPLGCLSAVSAFPSKRARTRSAISTSSRRPVAAGFAGAAASTEMAIRQPKAPSAAERLVSFEERFIAARFRRPIMPRSTLRLRSQLSAKPPLRARHLEHVRERALLLAETGVIRGQLVEPIREIEQLLLDFGNPRLPR